MFYTKKIESPIGKILLISNELGLCFAEFVDDETTDQKLKKIARKLNQEISLEECDILKKATRQFQNYFNKNLTTFNVPLSPFGTDFQKRVWNSLQEIPFGETKSYKKQSDNLNSTAAIRAVASANGKNNLSEEFDTRNIDFNAGLQYRYAQSSYGMWRRVGS